jgi:7-cyano-7-deazaguanine reductase
MFKDSSIQLPQALERGLLPPLETFERPREAHMDATGVIRIVFPEFTCVCPKTGYPDFASIGLYYLPDRLCLELKSWKLYLNAFRMVGAFHEAVTAHLFSTITSLLQPQWALVVGDFFPRGNVDTTVVFETDTPRPRAASVLIESTRPHCRDFGQH